MSVLHKSVNYLLRHIPTYLQSRDLNGASGFTDVEDKTHHFL